MSLPIDYLSAYALLEIAGLSNADCEHGADLLSSIRPSKATTECPDPAMRIVESFLVLYETHAPSAWEYAEKLAKKGYE
jgi:hypothetical protein